MAVLQTVTPVYAGFMVFTQSIGLQRQNGFVGEFLIILGGLQQINGQVYWL